MEIYQVQLQVGKRKTVTMSQHTVHEVAEFVATSSEKTGFENAVPQVVAVTIDSSADVAEYKQSLARQADLERLERFESLKAKLSDAERSLLESFVPPAA